MVSFFLRQRDSGNNNMDEKTLIKSAKNHKTLTGSQIVIEALKAEDVEYVFGYPGAIVLPIYDELFHLNEMKHILVRHEQAAVHAAEGYARVTGKPGVVLVTSGPGACNTITAIANAYYDGYPLVILTGQVDSKLIGNDAFQESDVVGITRSCCKHNYLVKDVKDLSKVIKEAFHIATTGKHGPVVIDLPKDVIDGSCEFEYPKTVHLPGYKPTYGGHSLQNARALDLLYKAKRPVIIAGGGVIHSEATKELFEFAKTFHIPVINSLMGTGAFPADEELALGMMGMFGHHWGNKAVQICDVIFAIGTRFSDRLTGDLKNFAKQAKIIHIDIDTCSINKNVPVDVPIVGDAKRIIADMIENIEDIRLDKNRKNRDIWLEQINLWKNLPLPVDCPSDALCPQEVIETIFRVSSEYNPVIATEVGQHQMWSAAICKFNEPRKFLTSGGLGTMGFGFPAAMGAQLACPDKLVIDIAGDGSVQMNIQELATCVENKISVKVCIINNSCLGMVRQLQQKFFNENYSETFLSGPDYVKLAEAYGAKGFRITKDDDIESVMRTAFETEGPVLIDFVCYPYKTNFPWVVPSYKDCQNVLKYNEE